MSVNVQLTVNTLGNAAQLATVVAMNVLGNEVADSVGGEPLTPEAIQQLAASRFAARFANVSKGA